MPTTKKKAVPKQTLPAEYRRVDAIETFSFLALEFNITLAKWIVLTRSRRASDVRVAAWSAWVRNNVRIDEPYALGDAIDIDQPVIIGQMPGNQGRLLLDGNHRMFRAIGENRDTVRGYYLTEEETHWCSMSERVWQIIVDAGNRGGHFKNDD